MDLYFISGLGTDWRAFQRIKLPEAYTIHHLEWIEPRRKDSLGVYARRLSKYIDTSKPFCLVGLSFGGMIASEMNRYVEPRTTILISSAATARELPRYVRLIAFLRLHRLVPVSWMKRSTLVAHWFFGTKGTVERKLLDQIIRETDPRFFRWAIDAIASWKNGKRPERCVHLHGDRDHVLPRTEDHDIVLKGAGHFMVFSHGAEVSRILEEHLARVRAVKPSL